MVKQCMPSNRLIVQARIRASGNSGGSGGLTSPNSARLLAAAAAAVATCMRYDACDKTNFFGVEDDDDDDNDNARQSKVSK